MQHDPVKNPARVKEKKRHAKADRRIPGKVGDVCLRRNPKKGGVRCHHARDLRRNRQGSSHSIPGVLRQAACQIHEQGRLNQVR